MSETTCQYLRGIIEGSHDLIAALDLNFKFTVFNRAYSQEFEDIFGSQIEVGTSIVDALVHLPQEQTNAVEIWGRALQGEEFTLIQEFGDENRARKYYEITYSSIRNENNELIGACHIIRDARIRIQAEREVSNLQENLEQQLAQLEAIYATAPSGLCFMDTNFRYVRVSDRLASINGLPASEHIGKSSREVLPELSDTLESLYRSVIETGTPILNHEIQGFTPAQPNVERNWLASYYPLKGADGGILGINIVVEEITERKQAEEKLLKQAEIIDQIHDSVISTDLNGIIVSWNQGASRLCGYTATEAIGQHISLIYQPEDRDTIQTVIIEPLLTKGQQELEEIVMCKSGELIDIHLSLSILRDRNQNPIGMIGYAIDITARKRAQAALRESEERYRILSETVPTILFSNFADGKNEYCNQRFYEYTGMPDGSSKDYGWAYALHPNDIERYIQQWPVWIQQGLPIEIECRFRRFDGEYRWFLGRCLPIRNSQGDIIKWLGICVDIHDLKETQQNLRESEEKFRQLAENIHEHVFWISEPQKNQIVYVSPAYEQVWQRQSASLYENYAQWYEAIPPEDRERVKTRYFSQALQGNYDEEYRITRADGSVRWIRDRGFPIHNPLGEPYRVVGIAEDITDRARAVGALRSSEETARRQLAEIEAIYTTAPVGLAFIDRDFRYIRINERLAQMNGFSVEAHMGRKLQELLPEIGALQEPVFRQLIETGKPVFNLEVRSITPAQPGVERDWLASYYPLKGSDGTILGINMTVLEITERKRIEKALFESERRYRFLADAIPEIVWTADNDGLLDYLNRRWYEYTGLAFEEIADDWKKVMHPDDVESGAHLWQEAVQNGTPYENEQRYLRAADSSYRWHLVRGLPFHDDSGNIVKWFGTCTDIHEQKQIEQERILILEREQAARQEAETANRIKDQFLAILSHELRSPLNPILGWTKLLKNRKCDEATLSKALDTIERNVKLQIQLIDDLLDISRILRGKLILNTNPVDLTTVINAGLETVRTAAQIKALRIETSIDINVGQVLGDFNRLQQVVTNLLTNAVKFTPNGGTIQVSLSSYSPLNNGQGNPAPTHSLLNNGQGNPAPTHSLLNNGQGNPAPTHSPLNNGQGNPAPTHFPNYAQIRVKDTGKGINPEFLPHIFEYFRQEDSSTTRQFGGLGLGLAIVSNIVEMHNGTVTVDSLGEGQGASFTIALPIIPSPILLDNGNSPQGLGNIEGMRILIVDDEPDTREFMRVLLEINGADVTVATSALDALNKLIKSPPEILISDLGMPEMDGYQLISEVRQLLDAGIKDIPAVALTAYAGEVDKQQVLAAGFNRHLAKPVDGDELIWIVTELVRGRG
jgi:PAS domain S-box-containing protein